MACQRLDSPSSARAFSNTPGIQNGNKSAALIRLQRLNKIIKEEFSRTPAYLITKDPETSESLKRTVRMRFLMNRKRSNEIGSAPSPSPERSLASPAQSIECILFSSTQSMESNATSHSQSPAPMALSLSGSKKAEPHPLVLSEEEAAAFPSPFSLADSPSFSSRKDELDLIFRTMKVVRFHYEKNKEANKKKSLTAYVESLLAQKMALSAMQCCGDLIPELIEASKIKTEILKDLIEKTANGNAALKKQALIDAYQSIEKQLLQWAEEIKLQEFLNAKKGSKATESDIIWKIWVSVCLAKIRKKLSQLQIPPAHAAPPPQPAAKPKGRVILPPIQR